MLSKWTELTNSEHRKTDGAMSTAFASWIQTLTQQEVNDNVRGALLSMPGRLEQTFADVTGRTNYNSLNESFNSVLSLHASKRVHVPFMFHSHVLAAAMEWNAKQRPNDEILSNWDKIIVQEVKKALNNNEK